MNSHCRRITKNHYLYVSRKIINQSSNFFQYQSVRYKVTNCPGDFHVSASARCKQIPGCHHRLEQRLLVDMNWNQFQHWIRVTIWIVWCDRLKCLLYVRRMYTYTYIRIYIYTHTIQYIIQYNTGSHFILSRSEAKYAPSALFVKRIHFAFLQFRQRRRNRREITLRRDISFNGGCSLFFIRSIRLSKASSFSSLRHLRHSSLQRFKF